MAKKVTESFLFAVVVINIIIITVASCSYVFMEDIEKTRGMLTKEKGGKCFIETIKGETTWQK
jgi:hypothetical protein